MRPNPLELPNILLPTQATKSEVGIMYQHTMDV